MADQGDNELIISTPESLTPLLLTEILRKARLIDQAKVTRLDYHAIGVGLLGDTMRFNITYDRESAGAPATIAGKFPAVDKAARAGGTQVGAYVTEVRFYQQIAKTLSTRVPACFYAEIDPQTDDFGLLLEDIGPVRAVDQLAGCSRADAEEAMRQAAKLHAARFCDSSLWSIEWMWMRKKVHQMTTANFGRFMSTFHEYYDGMLEPEYMRVADSFASKIGFFTSAEPKHFCLIHGDLRLDNMMFDAKGGEVPLILLDWQSIAPDNPAQDLALFMGSSYPMDLRSRDERDLLMLYHDEIKREGVKDYDFETIWLNYRQTSWTALFTAIVASAVAKRTERGDKMFMRLARGAATQMLEHDTLAFS